MAFKLLGVVGAVTELDDDDDDDVGGRVESNSGVADTASDLGVLPTENSADTTKLYVCNPQGFNKLLGNHSLVDYKRQDG